MPPLFLLFACDPEPTPADSAGPSDTGDTGEPDTTWVPAPCPAYSGYERSGTRWTYQGIVNPVTDEVSIVSLADGVVVVEEELVVEAMGLSSTTRGLLRFRCDAAGLWLVDVEYVATTTVEEETEEVRTLRVYSPPALVVPSDLADGDAWETHYVGITSSGGEVTREDRTVRNEVVGVEEVTVPAGTFTALRVVTSSDSTSTENWWDASAGLVLGEAVELVAYEP